MKEEEMFFFIADISGYTAYMINNDTASEHAKISITQLIKALVDKINVPIEISKLEGDAIFLYHPRQVKDPLWLTKKIFTFFEIFQRKINELKISEVCQCGACKNIASLQLKVIAHYGKATFQQIGRFRELAGVDVIILHRLLKNHVSAVRYFLLTEAAYQHMLLPDDVKVSKMEEHYEDVGTIPLYICDPPYVPESELPTVNTFWNTAKHWLQLHFAPKTHASFRNLPETSKLPTKD